MSIYGLLKGAGDNGFGYNSTAEQVTEGLDLTGKTYLLTGCNSGLGLETMRVLSLRGARVIGAARSVEKARSAGAQVDGETDAVACELSEPDAVRQAVRDVLALGHPLDGIICNAGIMALPELTVKHGYELQFLTNHVGHFILVTGLLEQLSATGRVVMVSSTAHTRAPEEGIQFDNLDGSKGYSPWGNYGQSKLANLLMARHLAGRLESGQTVNAIHPGVIATNLVRHMSGIAQTAWKLSAPLVLKSIPRGAATQTYVATHPDAAAVSGEYWADCNPGRSTDAGRDEALAARLWETTEEIVAGL
ncbi:MAG: NAD(P)-dependent dehydrogenase (short-subunit alcohol dehydrogenase family) [Myxococcota bacterium]|jgi:NAD(P)-dependent dehydrogenase (short-subunit alcohol dehydrogenase family)